jgi:DNA-directed RNA polymerase subunit RPC12/RpoP
MTEKGIIIARPAEGISLNGLEYLFEDERDEIRHFDSLEEANKFLAERSVDDEDIILQYHIFCQNCAKEFFFETDEMPEETETAFYVCPDCKKIIEEKQNTIS